MAATLPELRQWRSSRMHRVVRQDELGAETAVRGIVQLQPAAMALCGAPGDGQAEAVTGGALTRRAEERLAQLRKVLLGNAGAVVD